MHYDVVFDVTRQSWSDASWPLVGALPIFVAIILTLARRRLRSGLPAVIAYFVAIPSVLWVAITGFNIVTGVWHLSKSLQEGKCEIAEGVITALDPMPFDGHKYEKIIVGGKEFYYSDFIKTPGFHQSVSHGGPLRNGPYVRLYHLGNDIAKLEIGRREEGQITGQAIFSALDFQDCGLMKWPGDTST